MHDVAQREEKPKIRKSKASLVSECYNTPSTSLLLFHFEPCRYVSTLDRFQNVKVQRADISGKNVYLIDGYFSKTEEEEMRNFSKTASFSRNSYGSEEAIEKGEKPARSMNGKERWQFFTSPAVAIKEVCKLLGYLADAIQCDISTLPWELCDQSGNGSPTIIANFLEEASYESMELGKHRDSDPKKNVAFTIPVLYENKEETHPSTFTNGESGRPWLITLMLYVTKEDFIPSYQLGTVFYDDAGKVAMKAYCSSMRLVLFESDILHSIEESSIPMDEASWRVSYVFKLLANPKRKEQCIREDLKKMMGESHINVVQLDISKDKRA